MINLRKLTNKFCFTQSLTSKAFLNKFGRFSICSRVGFSNNLELFENINQITEEKTDYLLPEIFNNKENEDLSVSVDLKGRNSRTPKRANHGARPCSSVMRRLKKRAYFKKTGVKL